MINIAIDGPAGSGKSSICDIVAKSLSLIHVDTGALYRAIGVFAIRNGARTDCKDEVIGLLDRIDITLSFDNDGQHIFVNGTDYTEDIRLPEASMAASNVSAMPEVRTFLLDLQHKLADNYDIIMDGRDIGTVILPNANIKIFLTASPECRAMRRFLQLKENGFDADYEELLAEVKKRDYQDSTRAIAPLKQADDAWLCDTTQLNLEETAETIINYIKERL